MSPDEWFNRGWEQQRDRRYGAALASYAQALAGGVDRPEEAHLNRAVLFAHHLGQGDAAERELEAALALNPRFVSAWMNLGNLHEQAGERERARRCYEQALALEPGQPLALARLPDLRPVDGPGDPLIARLKAAIRAGAPPADLADLGFGLGKALDKAGACDEAFAAYVAANRASRASAGAGGARYDAAAQERYVDRLIATFSAPAPDTAPSPGEPERIFICGMFRSGSTLVEQILASHPRVTAGGELDLLPTLADRWFAPALAAWPPLDRAARTQLHDAYAAGVARLFPGAEVVTDKRPDNFLHIGLIRAFFPAAKIVHTRRDPLDNCLSVFFLHLSQAMPYALDLLDIAHWYRQHERLMAHWKALHGEAIHEVDYDRLVTEPRPIVEPLLAHCGLPWDDACLAFHATPTTVRTPSAWQVREPLYTRSSGRWRRYERHLGPLRAALGR
ncbi:MAG: sulfotransferase [Burkholderiales bacterium]|nr:sulfotransferase [Burkholderiales bacterium]